MADAMTPHSTLTAREVGLRPPATQTGRQTQGPEPQWSLVQQDHALGPETRWAGGWWVGRMASPDPGQGTAEGVAGLPGQVGPAWQGGWGGRQGGVCWVWARPAASTSQQQAYRTDPGRREEARQRPGGLAVVTDSSATPSGSEACIRPASGARPDSRGRYQGGELCVCVCACTPRRQMSPAWALCTPGEKCPQPEILSSTAAPSPAHPHP